CVGNKKSIGLVVFLSTFFGLVACQAGPEVLSAPVMGYNHTSAAINEFTVNGAGGPNLGPHQGGGGQVCCGVIPKYWVPGLEAIVEWEIDPNPKAELKRDRYGSLDMQDYRRHAKNYTHHKAVVEIPRYERPGPIRVHFLPCNQVRVTAAATSPGYPGYPYNYPMVMERVAECPKK
ncbi:MAG: DUF3304 domain-containing protein, partial [Pseudomonas aeruginosa]|nr:DUF3304 domain-containing protein [Pseudomonas aeruginosa]